MEIILLERIRNLGNLGDTVKVKAGYARNHLVPYGKAVLATEKNKAQFEARRAELEKAAAEVLSAAQKRAESFKDLVISLSRKASEEGKLFGSITVKEIAEAIAAKDIEVEKSEVDMPEGPIRSIGEFEAHIMLHSDVIAIVKIEVIAE